MRAIAVAVALLALAGCGDEGGSPAPNSPRPATEGSYRNDPGVEFFDVEHNDGQVYRCIYIYEDRGSLDTTSGGPALWCEQRPPR